MSTLEDIFRLCEQAQIMEREHSDAAVKDFAGLVYDLLYILERSLGEIDFDDFCKWAFRDDPGIVRDPEILSLLSEQSKRYLMTVKKDKNIKFSYVSFQDEENIGIIPTLQRVLIRRKSEARQRKKTKKESEKYLRSITVDVNEVKARNTSEFEAMKLDGRYSTLKRDIE